MEYKIIHLDYPASNNQAEYETLIRGLQWALEAGIKSIVVYSDSQIVVWQMNEEYAANSENLKKYFETASQLKRLFDYIQLCKIDQQ